MAERRPLSDIMAGASKRAVTRLAKQRDHVVERFKSPIGQVEMKFKDILKRYQNMTPEEMERYAEDAGHKGGQECDCELCAMIGYVESEMKRGKKAEPEAEEEDEDAG